MKPVDTYAGVFDDRRNWERATIRVEDLAWVMQQLRSRQDPTIDRQSNQSSLSGFVLKGVRSLLAAVLRLSPPKHNLAQEMPAHSSVLSAEEKAALHAVGLDIQHAVRNRGRVLVSFPENQGPIIVVEAQHATMQAVAELLESKAKQALGEKMNVDFTAQQRASGVSPQLP